MWDVTYNKRRLTKEILLTSAISCVNSQNNLLV